MSAYIIAIIILGCGIAIGACLMWYCLEGRISFWQDKYMTEHDLKERLLKQNLELCDKTLTIFHDLRGVIK